MRGRPWGDLLRRGPRRRASPDVRGRRCHTCGQHMDSKLNAPSSSAHTGALRATARNCTRRRRFFAPNEECGAPTRIAQSLAGAGAHCVSVTTATTSFTIVAAAWASAVVGKHTWMGRQLSGCVVAIIAAYGLSAVGLLPVSCCVYDFISRQLVPIAAALVMFEGGGTQDDPRRSDDGRTRSLAVAFVISAIGVVVGTFAGFCMVGGPASRGAALGDDGWKVASALCSSYVGGSINFAATASALGGPTGTQAAAAMGVDNCLMAIFIATCMRIPADGALNGTAEGPRPAAGAPADEAGEAVSARSILTSIFVALVTLGVARWLAMIIRMPELAFGMVAFLASLVSWLVRSVSPSLGSGSCFGGATSMGGAILMLYFVTIGAVAGGVDAASLLLQYSRLFLFTSILLTTHLACILSAGRILVFPVRMLLTVSNACVGGPGTALAMAEARGWSDMKRPAALIGSLGYAVGTFLGVGVAPILRAM